jgi:hypothetical protein
MLDTAVAQTPVKTGVTRDSWLAPMIERHGDRVEAKISLDVTLQNFTSADSTVHSFAVDSVVVALHGGTTQDPLCPVAANFAVTPPSIVYLAGRAEDTIAAGGTQVYAAGIAGYTSGLIKFNDTGVDQSACAGDDLIVKLGVNGG